MGFVGLMTFFWTDMEDCIHHISRIIYLGRKFIDFVTRV